jgi:hypothetical protein
LLFSPVAGEVEQLYRARDRVHLDELPIALAKGAAECLNIDQDVLVRRRRARGERRPDTLAVEGAIAAAAGARQREQRRHEIHHVQRLVADTRVEFARPVDDRGNTHPALVQRAFAVTEVAV